jgi:molybdate-binding protein/DNA-binding XRE family transcriptional regulator
MAAPLFIPHLRQQRTRAGISQSELSKRVGVTRQALIAIEAGRQVPSTALALELGRALGCRVEDLFALDERPSLSAVLAESLPPSGRLAIGKVDGRWVAHPLKTGSGASGDGASGERASDGLASGPVTKQGLVQVEPLHDRERLEKNVLVAGCAPLLGVVATRFERQRGDAQATWIARNSSQALELLQKGLVHIAGVHLVGERPDGHETLVEKRFPNQRITLFNLTRWQQGLLVSRGNPLGIRNVLDAARPDVRRVRRDRGSGAERLYERLAGRKPSAKKERTTRESGPLASSHEAVAQLIRLGLADVGIAIEAVAIAADLEFIPLAEERFDLIVPEARLEHREIRELLDLVGSRAFSRDAGRLPGYDLSSAGQSSTVPGAQS